MQHEIVLNCFNTRTMVLIDDSYDNYQSIVFEAKIPISKVQDGEFYICNFKKLSRHNARPGLVIKRNGIGPLFMVIGTTKHIDEWKVEGLDDESYASTSALFEPADVEIVSAKRIGKITRHDYNRIIDPVIKQIIDDDMNKLFEAMISIAIDSSILTLDDINI